MSYEAELSANMNSMHKEAEKLRKKTRSLEQQKEILLKLLKTKVSGEDYGYICQYLELKT